MCSMEKVRESFIEHNAAAREFKCALNSWRMLSAELFFCGESAFGCFLAISSGSQWWTVLMFIRIHESRVNQISNKTVAPKIGSWSIEILMEWRPCSTLVKVHEWGEFALRGLHLCNINECNWGETWLLEILPHWDWHSWMMHQGSWRLWWQNRSIKTGCTKELNLGISASSNLCLIVNRVTWILNKTFI